MNNAIQSEWALLGGLLLDNSRLSEIDVTAEDFAAVQNAEIFTAIQTLVNSGSNADAVTVADHLERLTHRKDWLGITGKLANNTPGAANVKTYARLMREDATRRRALAVAENLKLGLQDGLEAVDTAIRDLMQLAAPTRNHEHTIQDAVGHAINEIEAASKAGGRTVGITTGLADLDDCLGGLHHSDLYVVGARPSVGKTAFLLNLADNAEVPVGVISAEQPSSQIGLRLIAKNGKLSAYYLRLGKLDDSGWKQATNAVMALSNKAIFINDRSNPSIEDVMRQARKWKFQYDIKALYVDYIQRLRALPKAPRHEQVAYIALSLKEIARELDIPVIALAQVNRNVEERQNKRPTLGDLKDSGAIEQEADTVLLLYRDDVYDENSPDKGLVEVNVAKNRHGPTGAIRMSWHAETMTFRDLYRGAA